MQRQQQQRASGEARPIVLAHAQDERASSTASPRLAAASVPLGRHNTKRARCSHRPRMRATEQHSTARGLRAQRHRPRGESDEASAERCRIATPQVMKMRAAHER